MLQVDGDGVRKDYGEPQDVLEDVGDEHLCVCQSRATGIVSVAYGRLTPIPEMSGFPPPQSAPQICLRHGASCVKSPPAASMSLPAYAAKSWRTSKAAQSNVVFIWSFWCVWTGRSVEAGHSLDEADEKYSSSCAGPMRNMLICSICKAEHIDQAVELVGPQKRLVTMVAAPHKAEHACVA